MKIAIIGAGAIGGLVGARLALAGEDVTFVVRGRNLEAIRERGIKLITPDGLEHTARNVRATDDYADDAPTPPRVLQRGRHATRRAPWCRWRRRCARCRV